MRKEKQLLLDEVQEAIEGKTAFLITRYQGLTAGLAGDLRRRLREAGGEFEVVRKRLLVKAAENQGFALELSALPGHIGVVVAGEDPVGTAKAVFEFGKETEAVQVLSGCFNGQMHSATDVERISKLPSQEGMRAQLLGLFEAPMAQTLSVMEAILTSVIYCLENKTSGGDSSGEND